MKKKMFISLIALICGTLSLTSCSLNDADKELNLPDGLEFSYLIQNGQICVRIDDYTGNATTLTIPETFDGKPVSIIGYEAFRYCSSLTSVTLPNSIISIGAEAFFCCESLESFTIPDSVASIGMEAFYGCDSLTRIIISDSVTSIGYGAFRHCSSLKSVYYTGTEEQWNNILGSSNDNSYLFSATIHYNYVPKK